jgi:general secretion pathway protein K
MRCHRTRRSQQQGVALVIALLVFAICAALLVAMQRDFDLNYRRGANTFVAEQSWSYLRGAEGLASLALQLDFDADAARELRRDDLTEFWAQQATPYALDEGGWMFGSLEDLQGRFNLNSLGEQPEIVDGVVRYSPAQQAFIRLLQTLDGLELDQYSATAITEAIADWIDGDDEPRLNGAESSYYVSLTPSYRPANQRMVSSSELRAIAGITPTIYEALRPLVTVWPKNPAAINIHTVPLKLLRALNADGNLQPLSPSDGEALLLQRQETGFANVEEFLQSPVFADSPTQGLATLLGESSDYFLLASRVEIADREQHLYSVLRRQERQVDVLQRISPSLYDMPTPPETSPGE